MGNVDLPIFTVACTTQLQYPTDCSQPQETQDYTTTTYFSHQSNTLTEGIFLTFSNTYLDQFAMKKLFHQMILVKIEPRPSRCETKLLYSRLREAPPSLSHAVWAGFVHL